MLRGYEFSTTVQTEALAAPRTRAAAQAHALAATLSHIAARAFRGGGQDIDVSARAILNNHKLAFCPEVRATARDDRHACAAHLPLLTHTARRDRAS